MKNRILKFVAPIAVFATGFAASQFVQKAQATPEETFTTVYFMVQTNTTVNTTYDRAFTYGQPSASGTISSDCTDDSMGAVTGFTGTVYESALMFTHTTGGAPSRLPEVMVVGSRPTNGQNITAMATTGDDTCVHGGKTWQRYSGTIN